MLTRQDNTQPETFFSETNHVKSINHSNHSSGQVLFSTFNKTHRRTSYIHSSFYSKIRLLKYTFMFKQFITSLFAGLLFAISLNAQTKKNLTPEDYGKWQSIGVTDLSPNGEWLTYQILVQEDNDTLFVVNKAADKIYKLAFSSSPEISRDNQWIAYRIGIPFKEAEKLREQEAG